MTLKGLVGTNFLLDFEFEILSSTRGDQGFCGTMDNMAILIGWLDMIDYASRRRQDTN